MAADLEPAKSQTEVPPEASKGFTQSRDQLLIIESVRLGFLACTLAIIVGFQALQVEFLNVEWILPIYIMMAVVFLSNATYLLVIDKALAGWIATASLFILDVFYITGLIYFTGINQSIFLFLYLVNIILCGFVFQRRGAVLLALMTSTAFSALIIFGPDIRGQALFFTVGLNNLAFFSVAILSGLLSEQLNFMGSELLATGRDLRALRDLNNLIIDNIATGLVTLEDKGRILQLNPAAADIFEFDAHRLLNRNIDELLPGLLPQIHDLKLDIAARRSERFDYTLRRPDQDSKILGIIVSALPIGSSVSGYIITFQDLTKVRSLEFAMRQSEKMAAIGSLAAGIAHEIRNPLASISGSIQLLGANLTSRGREGEQEDARLMQIVLREIDRLNGLITEFLDFVRPDLQKDDPVNINGILKDIVEMAKFNKNLRQDIRVELDLASKNQIYGNGDKLKQALLNIIINAFQAMGNAEKPVLEIKTVDGPDQVSIRIKDSGVGIDERNLRKIFEPFHTTKPKGTGLGLAVTHKIIDNHGGRIFVESAVGQGTQFTIEIPVKIPGKLNLADSKQASDDFSMAFKGQKRGNA